MQAIESHPGLLRRVPTLCILVCNNLDHEILEGGAMFRLPFFALPIVVLAGLIVRGLGTLLHVYIGVPELVLIACLAPLIFGPRRFPRFLR
jgi:hypothetical protein